MPLMARTVSAFFQTGLIFLIFIYPYRDRLRLPVAAVIAMVAGITALYMTPYMIVGLEPYRLGYFRIFYSCLSILLQSMLICFLIRIRLSVIIFAFYVLRNLTDSLMMGARFFQFFVADNSLLGQSLAPVLYVCMLLLLTPVIIIFIEKNFKIHSDFFNLKIWRMLWYVPFVYYLFFRAFSEPHYVQEVIIWTPQAVQLPFIWFFGTVISHYVILKMMSETAQAASLKEQLKYFELLTGIQKREYDLLQDNISSTRKFRHDLRHHIIAIDGYLAVQDVNGARAYLNGLTTTLNKQDLKCYSSNHAINSLLNYYEEKASEAGILFSVSQGLHTFSTISDVDFCTILGNLLENALEGCLRNPVAAPFISIKIGQVGEKMTVISIRNSYTGSIRRKNQSFLSSKRDTEGIGTASVRYLVEKYHGVCNFNYNNSVFEASVLLNPA